MIKKEGQYYYCHLRTRWGVYLVGKAINGVQTNKRVADFDTKEEAIAYANKMNNQTN